MTDKPDQKQREDENQAAHRVVRKSTGEGEQASPPGLEEAWREWSQHIQKVDERSLTLLRAAFEAGYEAGASGGAASLGRAGGLKGGKARASKLTAEERRDIAQRAAQIRWANRDNK